MSSVDDHDLLDVEDGDDYGDEIDYITEEKLLQDEELEDEEEERSAQPDLILHNEEEIDEEEDNTDNTDRQNKFSTERTALPNEQKPNRTFKNTFRNKNRNRMKHFNERRRNFVHLNPHFNGTVPVNDGSRLVWNHQKPQQISPWVANSNLPSLLNTIIQPPPVQIPFCPPQQPPPPFQQHPPHQWIQHGQPIQQSPNYQQQTQNFQQSLLFPPTQGYNQAQPPFAGQTQGFNNQNFMQWNDHCEVPYSHHDQGNFIQNQPQPIRVHERLGFPQAQVQISPFGPQKQGIYQQTPSVINFNNYNIVPKNKRFNFNREVSPKKFRNNNARPVVLKQEIKISQTPKPATVENEKQDAEMNVEDEETRLYRLKIEEQKRKREEVLAKKEARRKLLAQQNAQPQGQNQRQQQPQQQHQHHKFRPQSNNITVKTVKYIDIMDNNKNPPKPSTFFEQRTVLTKDNRLDETNIVVIRNLSDNTDQRKIISLCKNIGDVEKLHREKSERQATIHFKSVASAHAFYKKYQRYMLDLSMIEVSLKPL